MKTANRTYRMLPDRHGAKCVRITTEAKSAEYLFDATGNVARGRIFITIHEDADAAELYTVIVTVPGKTTCTCPGYTYRSKCKHSALMASLVAAGKVGVE